MTRLPPLSPNAWLRWGLFIRLMGEIKGLNSVLEVGCGMGAMGVRFAEKYDYRGYEPDRESFMTAEARVQLLGRGDVRNTVLPDHPDRLFDLVIASEVLEHLKDDVAEVDKWRRWLIPKGHLLASVPFDPTRFGAADEAVGHFRRYGRVEMLRLLHATGFYPLALWVYGFPLGFLLEAARNRLARREENLSTAEGTAASGRWHQSTGLLMAFTRLGTAPFRLVQGPLLRSNVGTGLVVLARRDG